MSTDTDCIQLRAGYGYSAPGGTGLRLNEDGRLLFYGLDNETSHPLPCGTRLYSPVNVGFPAYANGKMGILTSYGQLYMASYTRCYSYVTGIYSCVYSVETDGIYVVASILSDSGFQTQCVIDTLTVLQNPNVLGFSYQGEV